MLGRADPALRRFALGLRYRHGGIEAINARLLLLPRVEEPLRRFGATIEPPSVLLGPLVIHNADQDYRNLRIGRNVHLGRLAILDLAALIEIAADCTVSMGTTILTHLDVGDRPLARRYPRRVEETRLGAGSYIGANATILPGCHIGDEAVVAAGAVVTRPVPGGAVVAGVPARTLEL